MPMKRIIPKVKKTIPLSETAWAVMNDMDPPANANPYELLNLELPATTNKPMWDTYADDVLAAFIPLHPCRRPSWWWLYSAPEQSRRRLGGIGTPAHEVFNYHPLFTCGIPDQWLDPEDIDDDIEGQAPDPLDPPAFESQAAYLQRHDLLTPAEVEHLAQHPELLAPEIPDLTNI